MRYYFPPTGMVLFRRTATTQAAPGPCYSGDTERRDVAHAAGGSVNCCELGVCTEYCVTLPVKAEDTHMLNFQRHLGIHPTETYI